MHISNEHSLEKVQNKVTKAMSSEVGNKISSEFNWNTVAKRDNETDEVVFFR